MNFRLQHPDDPTSVATYGHDPERGGAWAELTYCDVLVVYDTAEIDFDFGRPALSILRFLAQYGYLDGDAVEDVIEQLDRNCQDGTFGVDLHGWPREPRRAPRRLRRVLKVIRDLELAGG